MGMGNDKQKAVQSPLKKKKKKLSLAPTGVNSVLFWWDTPSRSLPSMNHIIITTRKKDAEICRKRWSQGRLRTTQLAAWCHAAPCHQAELMAPKKPGSDAMKRY